MKILIEESVLRQALEALEDMAEFSPSRLEVQITALRTALDAAENVEPVMRVVRNASGQIHMTDGEGNCFDMSKFVGQDFYTNPAPAVPEETK